ncbi:HigA family addiction module antitoxin [Nubsella zeaxanthinifaciens]|uniref:HigA family addiction module antitoxin n=1 Tax=Nubsella zeaxanthinifaciens TaxID=392412 RepID=UPI003CFD72AD
MSSNVKIQRELLTKPGDTILETIEFLRMSQVELAERLGKTPAKVNDLISGKAPITVNTAMQLEKVLGIDMQFWLNREMKYREKLARIEQEEFLDQCVDWLKVQPIKELKQQGVIKSEKKDATMVDELLQFYGVASPTQWEDVYVSYYTHTDFRINDKYATSLASLSAWLRIGELAMRQLDIKEYNKDLFKETLSKIRDLVYDHPEDYALQLASLCAMSGVAIVYTLNLPKAPISGATRWIGGNPLLQLTDRYKTNDQFWFTFYHEAAHILLHGKKDVFIEDFDCVENDDQKEREADEFASEWLLNIDFDDLQPKDVNEGLIKSIAREYKTHPGVVLGRLQKLGKVKYGMFDHLKTKVFLEYFINKII